MILLTFLNITYWIVSTITEAVFPALPQGVSSILAYIVNMIDDGLDILGSLFVDFSFVGPLCAFVIDVWIIMLGIDLMWKVIGYIKLSRKN